MKKLYLSLILRLLHYSCAASGMINYTYRLTIFGSAICLLIQLKHANKGIHIFDEKTYWHVFCRVIETRLSFLLFYEKTISSR